MNRTSLKSFRLLNRTLGLCLLLFLTPAVSALACSACNAADPVAEASAGKWQVEVIAHIDHDLATSGARFEVVVNGKALKAKQKQSHGDRGNSYDPHWLVEPMEDPNVYRLRYLKPVQVTADQSEITVRPILPDSQIVGSISLSPWLEAVDYTGDAGGVYGVYFPDEAPVFTISREKALSSDGLSARVLVHELRLADGDPAQWSFVDDRVTQVRKVSEAVVDLSAAEISISIPTERYGCFGVTLEVEDHRSEKVQRAVRYLGSLAVVPKTETHAFDYDGKFMISTGRSQERQGFSLAEVVKRLGFDWYRTEYPWDRFEPKENDVYEWSETDALHAQCAQFGLYTMALASHAPRWAQPANYDGLKLIPHWRDNYYFDGTPSPEHLDDWVDAWADYLERYKGVVKAFNVWNEPWEGGGISNWRSTGEYYRTLFKKTMEARDLVDPTVKVIGADSSDNTAWKLLAADMADDVDVMSIHYETPSTTSAWALGDAYGIEIWDTETWLAHLGDASIARLAVSEFLFGATKISLWKDGMLFDSSRKMPTPSTPGVAALAHLLDGTDGATLLHPERPPYTVLFRGKASNAHIAMLSTTLSEYIARVPGHPWSQQSKDQGTLLLKLPPKYQGHLEVLDIFANPISVPHNGDSFEIPVDLDIRFLRFTGPYRVLSRALNEAVVKDVTPVEIALEDVQLLSAKNTGSFGVRLTNVHPFDIEGELKVLAEWPVEMPKQAFSLNAGETRTFQFVTDLSEVDLIQDNLCTIIVNVATNAGIANWKERVRVAMVGQGSPRVDGDLSDWESLSVVPVRLHSSDRKVSASDLYDPQKPWVTQEVDPDGLSAEVAFSYDEDFLYVMARVEERGEKTLLPSMLTDSPIHEYQNAPMEHVYYMPGPRPPWVAPKLQLALGPINRTRQIEGFEAFAPTDPMYPYASRLSALHQLLLYPTKDGGAEVLRMRRDDFNFMHALPMDYAWMKDHCTVEGVQLEVKVDSAGYIYEAAIPWKELNTISHGSGDATYLSFLIEGQNGNKVEWSFARSQAGLSPMDWGNMNGKYIWGARTKWWFE